MSRVSLVIWSLRYENVILSSPSRSLSFSIMADSRETNLKSTGASFVIVLLCYSLLKFSLATIFKLRRKEVKSEKTAERTEL